MTVNTKIVLSAKDNTKAAFDAVQKRTQKLNGAFGKIKVAIAGVAGAGGLSLLIKKGLETGDALAKTADKIGITTEALAGLRFAAEQSGASAAQVEKGLINLQRRVSELSLGTGEAKRSFETLGLTIDDLNNLSADEQLKVVADRLQTVGNNSDRTRIAFDLFGRSGVDLINLLNNGSEGIEDFTKQAESLGLALSRVDAKQIERANDAVNSASKVFTTLTQKIAADFAPIIEVFANKFADASREAQGLQVNVVKLIKPFVFIGAAISDFVRIVKIAVVAIAAPFAAAVGIIVDAAQAGISLVIDFLNFLARKFNEIAAGPIARFAAKFNKDISDAIGAGFAQIEKPIFINTDFDVALATAQNYGDTLEELTSKPFALGKATAFVSELTGAVVAAQKGAAEDVANAAAKATANQSVEPIVPTDFSPATFDGIQKEIAAIQEKIDLEKLGFEQKKILIENELLTQEEKNLALQQLELEHQDNLTRLAGDGNKARLKSDLLTQKQKAKFLFDSGRQILGALATTNKKAFQLNKIASIGDAVVNFLMIKMSLKVVCLIT